MQIVDRWILDGLNQESVSILKQQYLIQDDGTETLLANPIRRGYANCPIERRQVLADVPSPYKEAIFAIWGDTPVFEDPQYDDQGRPI